MSLRIVGIERYTGNYGWIYHVLGCGAEATKDCHHVVDTAGGYVSFGLD